MQKYLLQKRFVAPNSLPPLVAPGLGWGLASPTLANPSINLSESAPEGAEALIRLTSGNLSPATLRGHRTRWGTFAPTMQRSSRSIVLCLVLQAHAAAGQQPPTPRVTERPRPEAREIPVTTAAHTRVVPAAESALAHPRQDLHVHYGPPRALAGGLAGVAFFGVAAALTLWLTRDATAGRPLPAGRPPRPSRAPGAMPHPGVEVRRVSIAFDWSALESIQQALGSVDPGALNGLHAAATRARDALADAHRAARYGAFETWSLDPAQGPLVFGEVADSLRRRATAEALDRARRGAGNPMKGPGFVVVTLLVATRGPLAPLPPAPSLAALMAALAGMIPARAEQLAAMEVVWSPTDTGGPLSAAEIAVFYPELHHLE